MREILFRGKRVYNGDWVYGYLFKIWKKAYILWVTTNGFPNMTEVIPETVGQFTGLIDKNRTKIFEGDLVIDLGWPKDKPQIVKWENRFVLKYTDGYADTHLVYDNSRSHLFEVIGNIHERGKGGWFDSIPEMKGGGL